MQRFVDDVSIQVESGHGGAGAVSFRRERYVPRGGPDGGDGGRGGNVVVRTRRNLKTLVHLTGGALYAAENGQPGQKRRRNGRDGKDRILEVPPGTTIRDLETGEVLADIDEHSHDIVLLTGGRGGKGNTHFKSSTHQTPRFAQPGEPGQTRRLRVELKLIADVGLVGLPNVGKSSLLQALTAAQPRIGNYPFTTRIPNLGVLRYRDQDIVLADIPGIIEGAAEGAGLGHQFLRHISRTAGLALLIDVTDPDPEHTYRTLLAELDKFDPGMRHKRRLVVATKCDLDPQTGQLRQMTAACAPEQVIGVSAATRHGLDTLVRRLAHMAAAADLAEEAAPGVEHGGRGADDE
ncbi:MAG: GTPase ObgE [Spirochaetaceae bacterium]|nr:MAG: GTPase ObgE [Spirochaetaceae bacterium]